MILQAYDQHLNMILGDVEEVITTVEIDDETYEEIVRVSYSNVYLFIPFFILLTCLGTEFKSSYLWSIVARTGLSWALQH